MCLCAGAHVYARTRACERARVCVRACVCECESVCVRVCLVRVLCKSIRAPVRETASARAGAYTCARHCVRAALPSPPAASRARAPAARRSRPRRRAPVAATRPAHVDRHGRRPAQPHEAERAGGCECVCVCGSGVACVCVPVLTYTRARVRASAHVSVCVRACASVRVCVCEGVLGACAVQAYPCVGACVRECARGCLHVRACARRYLLLRLHLEPARLRRDGRGRAVGRRWRRRVRPTLIGTGGALHSHTKPSVRAAASVCMYVGMELLVSVCRCLCKRVHVCVRARTRVCACVRVRV